MAVVLLTTLTPREGVLPAICLKSGLPTEDLVRVKGRAAPAWAGATIVFGLLPWLFVGWASSRSYDVLVPFRREAWERHRHLRASALVTFWLGIVLGAVVGALGGQGWVLLLLCVIGMVAFAVNDWRNSFGVRLGRDGGLELTRVHEDFAAAAGRTTPVAGPAGQ